MKECVKKEVDSPELGKRNFLEFHDGSPMGCTGNKKVKT
jgi:hypothetical protein